MSERSGRGAEEKQERMGSGILWKVYTRRVGTEWERPSEMRKERGKDQDSTGTNSCGREREGSGSQ